MDASQGFSPPGKSRYRISSTEDYHRNRLNSLGWELTVCNSLYPMNTPIRRMLARNDSYGNLLYDFLGKHLPTEKLRKVIEIGGGYGYLMKDFLGRNRAIEACMVDISPFLLERQRETLEGYNISYRLEDALETDTAMLKQYQLAILNENLGDFPVLLDLEHDIFDPSFDVPDPYIRKVLRFFKAYDLEPPADERFNVNIGAMELAERLCLASIPSIFIGEHSCEATVPGELTPFLQVQSTGNPRKISLKGHDEYTIKLSYLQKIGVHHGYRSIRGPFADYIVPSITPHLTAILATRGLYSDSEEIICQFVGDLYQYEYLILVKEHFA